ncbi:MAG: hypothetical protein EAZ17_02290 [Sphingobacteriales bacterium]|nr:MAG: hypothetical protein EAZ17_02290 [Sphingobacteriales bacterium]
MTGPGRKPMMAINTVHSGDYLQEIHEYYETDSLYGFRKSSLSALTRSSFNGMKWGGGVVTFKDGAYQWIHLTD